jgi:rSAM/selenodomain-associated transferase 1
MSRTHIIIFAKAPAAGLVKTRLIPALGADGAARLAKTMLRATIEEASAAGLGVPELCATPEPGDAAWDGVLPAAQLDWTDQGEGELGERLARAARRPLLAGKRVLLIGSDCPQLTSGRLRAAAAALDQHDAVIQPAQDGGYALLGLRRFDSSLFEGISWSTPAVSGETLDRIEALGWTVFVGDTLRDVDRPEDLEPMEAQS